MHIDSDHYVNALVPVADAFAGTKATDVIKVAGDGIEFLVYSGVGATGTSTFTVLACDDVVPTTTSAVTFWYKEVVTDPGDTSWTLATTAGWTRTLGTNAMFRIWVPAEIIGAEGYGYAKLQGVEVTDSPVLGGVIARIVNTSHQPQKATVIT